jgi:hypothetical protein
LANAFLHPLSIVANDQDINAQQRNFYFTRRLFCIFKKKVLPYTPDAWIDETKTQIGYETNFTKHFYKPVLLRTLAEITAINKKTKEEPEQRTVKFLFSFTKIQIHSLIAKSLQQHIFLHHHLIRK